MFIIVAQNNVTAWYDVLQIQIVVLNYNFAEGAFDPFVRWQDTVKILDLLGHLYS